MKIRDVTSGLLKFHGATRNNGRDEMQSHQIDLKTNFKQPTFEWVDYQRRRRENHTDERSSISHDMIMRDIKKYEKNSCTVLDIGSGLGFDGNPPLQESIARESSHFIGVEPDTAITPPSFFDEWHSTTLEQSGIKESSVDVAYAFMVLEHIDNPEEFFRQVRYVLKDDGVFWGFTINRYCLFTLISQTMETLRLKELYLRLLGGERGEDRYLNYPTFYRANCVRDISRAAEGFSKLDFIPMWKSGQLDYYLPGFLHQPFRWMDHGLKRSRFGAAMISVRLQAGDDRPGTE